MAQRIAKNRVVFLAALATASLTGVFSPSPYAQARQPAAGTTPTGTTSTIGLVLSGWRNALVETGDAKAECAQGLQPGEHAQFKATPGIYERVRSQGGTFETRGPIGETGNFNPLSVTDYLPFRELTTKTGFGFNLDGTQDGGATAKSRRHDKFTTTQGEKVDHELARVVGCVAGYRSSGILSDYMNNDMSNNPVNRMLVEITGVDNEQNDPAVDVTIYKGMDRLVRQANGDFLPFSNQRIDSRFSRYTYRMAGRIVDGVVITEPLPRVAWPYLSMSDPGERDFRDFHMQVKLTSTGAEILLGGYENWRKWYNAHSKKLISGQGGYSSPSIYRALQRYADAYPDPETGEYQYISAAYKVAAVRARIVHPARDAARLTAR